MFRYQVRHYAQGFLLLALFVLGCAFIFTVVILPMFTPINTPAPLLAVVSGFTAALWWLGSVVAIVCTVALVLTTDWFRDKIGGGWGDRY